MYQKDYILRMIEMLGDLIMGILGMLKRGRYKEAEEKLGEAFYTMLRKDAAFFADISVEKLTPTLIEDHNYTNDHLFILAELLYAQAELDLKRNRIPDSVIGFQKSLALYEFVDTARRTWSEERQERMKVIRGRIGELMKNEEMKE